MISTRIFKQLKNIKTIQNKFQTRHFNSTPQQAINKIQVKSIQELPIFRLDHRGNTILHHAAKEATTKDELNTIIKHIGIDLATIMAKIINHDGKLPIDILNQRNRIHLQEQQNISSILLKLMKHNDVKPLHQPVDSQQIIAQFANHLDPTLELNLRLACEVVNEVRALKLLSNTHPEYNNYPEEKKQEANNRNQSLYELFQNLKHYSLDQRRIHSLIADACRMLKIANCEGYAFLIADILRQKNHSLPCDIYTIANGEHWILFIGDEKSSNRVMIDGLSGTIAPCSQLESSIQTYRQITENGSNTFNVFTSYNPSFHHLNKEMSIPRVDEVNTINPKI